MTGMLEPNQLLSARRHQRFEISPRHFGSDDVIVPALEKINRHFQSRRFPEEIDREEFPPEMFEGKLRAADQPDQIGQAVGGRKKEQAQTIEADRAEAIVGSSFALANGGGPIWRSSASAAALFFSRAARVAKW